jgi:cob(I)alamin adenosyltransferase
MVKLTKIYTRGGDAGETSLGDGARVRKDALRVEAYGTVDEANSIVGLARLHTGGLADEILSRVQNDLFDLGADLCRPEDGKKGVGGLRVSESQVERLESEIDRLNADLAPLESFILPGGTPAAAHLHQARTVARRAERLAVALAVEEAVNDQAVKYLNRLSDLFFVMARHCNDGGARDVLWTPGANR